MTIHSSHDSTELDHLNAAYGLMTKKRCLSRSWMLDCEERMLPRGTCLHLGASVKWGHSPSWMVLISEKSISISIYFRIPVSLPKTKSWAFLGVPFGRPWVSPPWVVSPQRIWILRMDEDHAHAIRRHGQERGAFFNGPNAAVFWIPIAGWFRLVYKGTSHER